MPLFATYKKCNSFGPARWNRLTLIELFSLKEPPAAYLYDHKAPFEIFVRYNRSVGGKTRSFFQLYFTVYILDSS